MTRDASLGGGARPDGRARHRRRYGVGLDVRGGSCPGLVGPGWGVDGARTESCAIAAPISSAKSTTIAMNVDRRTVGG
jgi:hypothetical protein